MTMMTGSEAIIEVLQAEGVEYVFGLPGSTEVRFMTTLQQHPEIKYILALHEGVVLGMAEGYSRESGKVGFVNLHNSSGLASAMAMLTNAYRGGIPLVITAGQQDSRLLMQEPPNAGDYIRMTSQFTKWSTEVSYAADIPIALRRAFKVATQPPAGPVFVSLPQDVLAQNIELDYIPNVQSYDKLRADQEAIADAADLLINAKNPVIMIDSGVAKSEAVPEAVLFAEMTGSRVYQVSMISDMNFPTTHVQYLGAIGTSSPDTIEMLKSVDVLVVIGSPLRSGRYLPEPVFGINTKIIQVDNDPWEMAKNFSISVGIQGDIKTSLAELNEVLQKQMTTQISQAMKTRVEQIAEEKAHIKQSYQNKAQAERNDVPISISRLMQEIAASLEPGTVVVDDCWTSSTILHRYIDFTELKSYQRARGGCIGSGMSTSLGIKLASPDRPVVVVTGDGSAMFSIQSVWTAAHYNLPVTYIVCANRAYNAVKRAMITQAGGKSGNELLGVDFDKPRIDFCQMAQAMGGQGIRVKQPEELTESLRLALASRKPFVVEVDVDLS